MLNSDLRLPSIKCKARNNRNYSNGKNKFKATALNNPLCTSPSPNISNITSPTLSPLLNQKIAKIEE
jgi:hypothetical protein